MKNPLLRMLWCVSVAPFGAPVVPEVNWMLIGSGQALDRLEGESAGQAGATDLDQMAQRRHRLGVELARRGGGDFRHQRQQHRRVVAGFERRRCHQCRAFHLVQRVIELGDAIGRVDGDQNEPGLGGGELGDHPFGVVRRPDADAIARHQPECQQAGCEIVNAGAQFAPGQPHRLLAHHQGEVVRLLRYDAIESLPDRFAQQRFARHAAYIADRHRFFLRSTLFARPLIPYPRRWLR
jgi:hypothetical protein